MTSGAARVPTGTIPVRPPVRRAGVRHQLDSTAGVAGSRGTTTTTLQVTDTAGASRLLPAAPSTSHVGTIARRTGRAGVAPRAGLFVIFLAGALALAAPLLRPVEPPAAVSEPQSRLPAVVTTSNVRARPEAGAAIVAILPAGRTPAVLGRLADSSWLLVQAGPTEAEQGWLPADRLPLSEAQRESVTVAQPAEASAPAAQPAPAGLPDLVIASVFLMKDGHIALEIRNDGEGPLTEARVPVLVTRASGETVGVLEVGPTTLPPRGTATVVTPVIVLNTGTYTLQLDRQESINEARRDNNGATRLLVAGGG